MTRLHRAAAALAALPLVLLACGGDDGGAEDAPAETTAAPETSAAAAETTAATAAEAAFPVTITNRLGEVVIASKPERIVALGTNDVDVVYGLGLTPVGVGANASTGGLAPWLEEFSTDGVEVLTLGTEVPIEQIAALEPDVILASPLPTIDTYYEQLGQIAPIVADTNGVLTDTWQERTRKVGVALGMEAEAEALVAAGEADLQAVADDYPGLDGKTYTMSWARSPEQIVVMAVDDITSEMLAEIGLTIAPSITECRPPRPAAPARGPRPSTSRRSTRSTPTSW